MITVETNKPVYSNLKGSTLTPEEKRARRTKQYEGAKNVYGKAKESGLLSAIENLALNVGNKSQINTNPQGNDLNITPPLEEKTDKSLWSKLGKPEKDHFL
jgi:hypothetical protein